MRRSDEKKLEMRLRKSRVTMSTVTGMLFGWVGPCELTGRLLRRLWLRSHRRARRNSLRHYLYVRLHLHVGRLTWVHHFCRLSIACSPNVKLHISFTFRNNRFPNFPTLRNSNSKTIYKLQPKN